MYVKQTWAQRAVQKMQIGNCHTPRRESISPSSALSPCSSSLPTATTPDALCSPSATGFAQLPQTTAGDCEQP